MRVFLTSPWLPAEWVRAHGLESQGIWFAEQFRRTAPALSAGTCAFAEQVVQFAESPAEKAVVFTTGCDQLRRAFDEAAVRGSSRTFLFNLPATQSPAAKQIYGAELERLGRFLTGLGGAAPTAEILGLEMQRTDAARHGLREAAPTAEARSFAGAAAQFHRAGQFSPPAVARTDGLVPLALLGGPLSLADWALFDALEAAGGRVVLNGTDAGERGLSPHFEPDPDPFAALADGYFAGITDVFQRPNTRLYAWLKSQLPSRGARGLVLWCLTGCDLWRAEMQTLREILHLPVLLLEADDAAGISPRDASRLQAFVETLQ